MSCNCENSYCQHGGGDPSGAKWKPCPNKVDGRYRMKHVGECCEACYLKIDVQYRLPVSS